MRTSASPLPVSTRLDRTEVDDLRQRGRFLSVDLVAPSDRELDELGDPSGFTRSAPQTFVTGFFG